MKSICRVAVHCQQVWCTRNTIQRCSKVSCLHAQPLHAQLLLVRSQDEEHVQQCCQRNATMVLCNASKQVCKSASLVHKGQILERLCASLRMLNQCCCSLKFKPHWQTVYQKKKTVCSFQQCRLQEDRLTQRLQNIHREHDWPAAAVLPRSLQEELQDAHECRLLPFRNVPVIPLFKVQGGLRG